LRRSTKSHQRDAKPSGAAAHLDDAKLRALITEATVDAHDESEQAMGFWSVLEDELALPFRTRILGVEVLVEEIGMADDDEIVAVCTRGTSRQKIRIIELPLPDPPPKGAEWIEAYRRWRRMGE
jgi:hypothetical protein